MVPVKSPLPHAASVEDDLRQSTFMVRCPYCKASEKRATSAADGSAVHYGYDELLLHIRQNHTEYDSRELSGQDYETFAVAEASAWDLRTAVCILDKLHLSQGTLCFQVSKKVVCLCGNPEFEQPTTFSSLVRLMKSFPSSIVGIDVSTGQ